MDYKINIHYKLIRYDKNINIGAFNFENLPFTIKEIIINRCMSSEENLFSLIPDFKNFIKLYDNEFKDDRIGDTINKHEHSNLIDMHKSDLYDDKITIQIYFKSLHKKVGEGSGEKIVKEEKTSLNVLKLNLIKDWRRMLDNTWIMDNDNQLKIDGKLWPSVQHYLYGMYFINIPDIYNKFTYNNKETSTIELTKEFYNKMYNKYKKIITDNNNNYTEKYNDYLKKALLIKFTNKELKKILLLTDKSKINIYTPGKHFNNHAIVLMKIRNNMK
jgi:predicted NAD-dependent protein-ADP-ribosyltransferase YbiA (DUF1768 family)